VAAMLAMALPIALIGLMQAPRRREQFVYGLAACIVLAGGLATYKKTSIVAPAIIFVTVGLLWPRRIVRLVPIIVILVGAAHFLAPGALGSVAQQFTGGRLTAVGTTVHRLDGFDAIRPIVWSHPLLGEGIGGYNALQNRILDNQMLDNVIQIGALGACAFVAMILSVVGTAIPFIRSRGPSSTAALATACAAVCFLTVSFLFDSLAYTHLPYIFLMFAALMVVLRTRANEPQESVRIRSLPA
jgi:polysaccharide biosynthesis protein PslJ